MAPAVTTTTRRIREECSVTRLAKASGLLPPCRKLRRVPPSFADSLSLVLVRGVSWMTVMPAFSNWPLTKSQRLYEGRGREEEHLKAKRIGINWGEPSAEQSGVLQRAHSTHTERARPRRVFELLRLKRSSSSRPRRRLPSLAEC
jgi:hypothetical protein